MNVSPPGRAVERLDNVSRRPGLRIPAAEIDHRLSAVSRGSRDASKQRPEVLLGKATQPIWPKVIDCIFSRSQGKGGVGR